MIFATKGHPSKDGCLQTYWGCEFSSPTLSTDEISDLFGHDDGGVMIIGGFGRTRKLSCRYLTSLDHNQHFEALLDQIPSPKQIAEIKENHPLTLEFYRFWLGEPGVKVPTISAEIQTIIESYGASFEDVPTEANEQDTGESVIVTFRVSGKTMDHDEITLLLGAPTKTVFPTDHMPRPRSGR